LEVAHDPAPAIGDGIMQQSATGKGLSCTFADSGTPEPPRTRYFEMLGSQGIYKDAGVPVTADYDE
jgi:hypothetical protein